MAHVTVDPPRRHRLSVADYYRMAEVGILAPDARVELIEGDIIDMAPPGDLHSAIVMFLTRALVRAVGDRALVLAQDPLRLSDFSEPQPDFALLRPREDEYRGHRARAEDALLVVEVALSSLPFDDRHVVLIAFAGVVGNIQLYRLLASFGGSYRAASRVLAGWLAALVSAHT